MTTSKSNEICVDRRFRSPNFGSRRADASGGIFGGVVIDMVIIHYTDMPDAAAALDRLCQPEAQVSAHYLIDHAGAVFSLVDEDKRAWHAGVACWQGADNINDRSIGIELDYPGHSCSPEGILPAFSDKQIDSLIVLLREIIQRHDIPVDRVLGHQDVAPERKIDPGPLFPWARLIAAGVAQRP